MFICDWQHAFKAAYLDVAHALQARYEGDETAENNKDAVIAMKQLCDEFLTRPDGLEGCRTRGEGKLRVEKEGKGE